DYYCQSSDTSLSLLF
nr:immunoglobulin light chain junction region [Macaca mulatta]